MKIPLSFDMNTYHAKVATAIASFLSADSIIEVSAYKRYDSKLPGRIVSFEFSMADPAPVEDCGTGQWQAELRFGAYVIVPFVEDSYLRECRRIALKLAGKIYGNRFECPCGPAKVISCAPDSLALPGRSGRENEADDYEVYKVEWHTEALIGESVWDNDGPALVSVSTIGNGQETILIH